MESNAKNDYITSSQPWLHIGMIWRVLGRKHWSLKPTRKDVDLIDMVCTLDIWNFKNSLDDSNTQARLKCTNLVDFIHFTEKLTIVTDLLKVSYL